MSGKPGRSGGARVGAGRKPKEPVLSEEGDPVEFLLGVMQGTIQASALQVRSAIAAAQYVHTKKGDGGKKEGAQDKAERVAGDGLYAPAKGPRLVVNNR